MLERREYDLLRTIESEGDFAGYNTDGEDDPEWILFGELEDRGLVDWRWGPISVEVLECCPEEAENDCYDPCVSPTGRLAMLCYRAATATCLT